MDLFNRLPHAIFRISKIVISLSVLCYTTICTMGVAMAVACKQALITYTEDRDRPYGESPYAEHSKPGVIILPHELD